MSAPMWLIHRYREQARSHTGSSADTKLICTPQNLWEQSLLAMAVDQLHQPWMCRRLREQALLPQVLPKQI
ncbi:hypothetical protein C1C98_26865 [Pseudomonas ogarae]|uniref:LasR-specific antiactivator QslA domain-containing protein n=1 Tax=Pseudomonas ogarae (strain DSM 112162 / CECT 30235 / F113) TaxID=1114970 RepID=A0ABM6R5T4_PSEO1|nr:hypothetical protein C1C98_26865 [Pseudomonas ogarae]